MPFEVAWTDTLEEESFVAFHREKLTAFAANDWSLPLVVFHDGEPIGVQELGAMRFAERRTVTTGSWLGSAWQRRGFGTEMRSAVLSLAFDGLGADLAVSGAIEGNQASLGVSRKLGYEVVGSHLVSPRGTPVEHTDLELTRARFRSPVRVDLLDLDALLPLFGAAP